MELRPEVVLVPVALSGVDHGQPVLALDAELVLRRLQVPLKRVHAADVEPDVLLRDTHENPLRTERGA